MSLNTSLFNLSGSGSGVAAARPPGTVDCPRCAGRLAPAATADAGQVCPFCGTQLQIRVWPVARRSASAGAALPEQATCFFHPDKAFQACCQRCGRFLCGLCDLQLGAEHVCPTCFDRGRGAAAAGGGAAPEWRQRDVLYDSIAVAVGWGWILFWPTIIGAIPTAIVLHVKHRKAPRGYLVPRSGWRFWVAYLGFLWLPLLITGAILIPLWMRRR